MTWLAYFIAGISTAGFVTIWFITSAKELAHAKREMEGAIRQLQLQENTYPQARDGPYEKAASNSLETTRMIYRETVKGYEHTRQKPMNRFPALVLGYPPHNRKGAGAIQVNYFCEDCGFLFQRSGEVTECPNCEKRRIRPATEQETERLLRLLNQKRANYRKEERIT